MRWCQLFVVNIGKLVGYENLKKRGFFAMVEAWQPELATIWLVIA